MRNVPRRPIPALAVAAALAAALDWPAAAAPAKAPAAATAPPVLRTAAGHPMKYWLSLPTGWTAAKTWAVLVVVTDARREFEATAREFARARGTLPVVIVVPATLTSGGTAQN